LKGARVERILVSDPYITANEAALAAFQELVEVWHGLWQQVPKAITVQYAQATDLQDTRMREMIAGKMKKFLVGLGATDSMVIQLSRLRNRDFHDRRIEFTIAAEAAMVKATTQKTKKAATSAPKLQRVIVELSGGIFRLVSPDKECRLYRIKGV